MRIVVMRCALALFCAYAFLDHASAGSGRTGGLNPVEEYAANGESDISDMRMMSRHSEDHARLPRRYPQDGDSRLRRLNIIDRRTGFDGRVRRIHFGTEENVPGIRAYGVPEPDIIQPIPKIGSRFAEPRFGGDPRSGRLPEDVPKNVADNGRIEVLSSPKLSAPQVAAEARVARSTRGETENNLDDLEGQEAKVFRPLFVYRQQVAQREKRRQNRREYESRAHRVTHDKSCGHYHGR